MGEGMKRDRIIEQHQSVKDIEEAAEEKLEG